MKQTISTFSINKRTRFALFVVLAAVTVTAGLTLSTSTSQASSPRLSARTAAASAACSSYLASIQPTTSEGSSSNSATIVESYPTTAGNLAAWLLNFDPLAESSAYQSIPSNEEVSACVLQGNWTLPSQSNSGSNDVNYEIVMVAPDGTATPLMWGPTELANAAAPAAGN
jgi:hypothetical protein